MMWHYRDCHPSVYTRIKCNAVEIAELICFLAVLVAGVYEILKHALPFIH
jgi:hypothetical protein